MEIKGDVFHESYYDLLSKMTKKELIAKLEDSQIEIKRTNYKLDVSGSYSINIFKNKKKVQSLDFTLDDNPHGTRYDEITDLEHSLMSAYQDYESLVQSEIIIKNDWDETGR
tara:strand:+ start:6655 stop:6990 length:336 start_codon:yes stop_codon:yes gene_type:complete